MEKQIFTQKEKQELIEEFSEMDENFLKSMIKYFENNQHALVDFESNICPNCKKLASSFDKLKPCLHWLLFPKGLKKKVFKEIFNKYDFIEINEYLRFISYSKHGPTKINDIFLEKDSNKLWETSIEYENLRWVITCSDTDLTGHKNTKCNFPHYHFSMSVDNLPFVSFNDFHPKLTDDDIYRIKCHNNLIEGVGSLWTIPGMNDVVSELPESISDLKRCDNVNDGQFNVNICIEMNSESGTSISDAFTRSVLNKTSFAAEISKESNVNKIISIRPGKAVPKIERKLSRGQKKKEKKGKSKLTPDNFLPAGTLEELNDIIRKQQKNDKK